MSTQQSEQRTPKSPNKAKRAYHSRDWWLQHYYAWQTSGASKTQYCKDNDISLSSFCNWSIEFSAPKDKKSPPTSKQQTFIKALITPEVSEAEPGALVKTLSFQELTLTFDTGLTKEAVAEWISTLKSLTC